MPRYKLTIEYDGHGFVGWQRQDNGPSIQEALETAIAAFSGDRAVIAGAGRTDAGVHALGQVAHVDLRQEWRPNVVRDAVNHHLKPAPIAVVEAERAQEDFHARFSATGRLYLYVIVNRRAPLTFDRGRAWRVPTELDAASMHKAAQALCGRHDFTTFRDAQCQADSPIKTLDRLDVARDGDRIRITAAARSFLHRQVRSMVGTLVQAGAGKWSASDVADALAARDRARCGPVAPPDGLYLTAVRYEPD